MGKNYLKIALRNLWKHKRFSAINIAGLSIGMAACLLILQYVSFKLSFDQFNQHVNDVYRVVNDRYQHGKLIQHGTITYSGVGRAMKDDFEEVVLNTRVEPSGEKVIRSGDKKLVAKDILYVENSFFSLFNYPLAAGDMRSIFKEPYTVLLSETLARKLFDVKDGGFERLIGKTLVVQNDTVPYRIQGVFKDVPENSHLVFELLISYQSLISGGWAEADYNFTESDFWHYVLLKPGADYKALNAKMDAFSRRHFQGSKVSGSDETFYLQPLSKVHLYSDVEYEIGKTGSATVVWGLLVIALFIITIAWVNYINLATARSTDRAREVGVRKVLGGIRRQLIIQFLTESVIVNLISLGLSFLLVFVVQGSFNRLLRQELSLSYLFTRGSSGYGVPVAFVLITITGMFGSGFYPAFVLSSFKPIAVLKGKLNVAGKGLFLRKALVIGQFSITVALIIGSVVVIEQLRYMNQKELGFGMDQLLVIKPPLLTEWDSTFIRRTDAFKEALKQINGVKGAATSWSVPGGDIGRSFNVRRVGAALSENFTTRHTGIDYDFIPVYGIKLLAGRNFSPTDHNPDFGKLRKIIINRSACQLLGFASPEAAIGNSIMRGQKQWDVTGVVADYHQKSLRYPLEPIIFMPAYSNNSSISVKMDPANIPYTIGAIRQTYNAFFPGNLFDYFFLDDRFNQQYENERLFSKVFGIFASLAIFIACLGLLGLAMFSTVQRTKEIGVRKVLGASVSSILLLLSKDFVKLVLVATIIAFPLAWWVMNQWLQDFSYRIHLNGWMFVLAGAMALLVALAAVSFQTIRAAMANPVKSLRTE